MDMTTCFGREGKHYVNVMIYIQMLNVGKTLVLHSNIIHQNMDSILGTENLFNLNYVVKSF